MQGRLIEENLLVKERIIDTHSAQGARIHAFLLGRAKALAGRYIDFDATPVRFVLSDKDEPNAFFTPITQPQDYPKRDDYRTVYALNNPLGVRTICVTRGLIERLDSLDKLDFVLGHELTHLLMRAPNINVNINTKGEEALADLHGIDLVYDAGADPKIVLGLLEDLHSYAQGQDAPEKRSYNGDNKIAWSEIFDVHISHSNRMAAAKAKLTKLSHLIDGRTPTPLDKSIFEGRYHDALEDFLSTHGYEHLEAPARLKLLIDSVDHLAQPARAQAGLYYDGALLDKDIQQKIARLAYDICQDAALDGEPLFTHLLDAGYAHIKKHGYPDATDTNYLDAASMLYSYFYVLFEAETQRNETDTAPAPLPFQDAQIIKDIVASKAAIIGAQDLEGFDRAYAQYAQMMQILGQIEHLTDKHDSYKDKLDNLSAIHDSPNVKASDRRFFSDMKDGPPWPWEGLVDIAATQPDGTERIGAFLEARGIEDYRITHDLPYVYAGYERTYYMGAQGPEKIEAYALSFATQREMVLAAYAYIKDYFAREDAMLHEVLANVLKLDIDTFGQENPDATNNYERNLAYKYLYDFVNAFNALPDERQIKNDHHDAPYNYVEAFIQNSRSIPGKIVQSHFSLSHSSYHFDANLLAFNNPIFSAHFGADYRDKLLANNSAKKQALFDALPDVLDRVMMLHKQTRASKAPGAYGINERCESFLYNIFYSAITHHNDLHHLTNLREEQKRALCQMVVTNKDGILKKLFRDPGYERFCDYLGILEEQIGRAINRDYTLTPDMTHVAAQYGIDGPMGPEGFAKVRANMKRTDIRYPRYLRAFELIGELEKSPLTDLMALADVIVNIEENGQNVGAMDTAKLVAQRHKNYLKLMQQSPLLPLMVRAISTPANYADLSFDALCQSAQMLINARETLGRALGEDAQSYDKTASITPEHHNYLNVIEESINKMLARAEALALTQQDRLAGHKMLYELYKYDKSALSTERNVRSYLRAMDRREGRLNKIAALSNEADFWPKGAFAHIKAFAYAKRTYLDNQDQIDQHINTILDKVKALPAGKVKTTCLISLLDQNLRAPYPETRQRLFDAYVTDLVGHIGQDDGSPSYQAALAAQLKKLNAGMPARVEGMGPLLSRDIAAADKYMLMRQVGEACLTQEGCSELIKVESQIKLDARDMLKSYLYGIGVDSITEALDREPTLAKAFVSFFNSSGETADCQRMSTLIRKTIKEHELPASVYQQALARTTPTNLKIMYENFWAAPLEGRAIINARIIDSATKDSQQGHAQDWQASFDIVMDSLIAPDDKSTEAAYARDIMHAYIGARKEYERELILSAMMVANRKGRDQKSSIGKALRLFLENMGPAEIKLGQAIASHPETPPGIAEELQQLKSAANTPARWEIYEWIRAQNIDKKFWHKVPLGRVLGSASYYTSVALGDGQVLRLLRPQARERAQKGFEVIADSISTLKNKPTQEGRSYDALTSAVQEMVSQAAKMSYQETQHDLGARQCQHAMTIYEGGRFKSDGHIFNLKVMPWQAKGDDWVIMRRAKGVSFNKLPVRTPQERAYKRAFAKAYIVFELGNILSGKAFDHDRHGDQLCIDSATGEVGIFDTGAMELTDPSAQDQQTLGRVLYTGLKQANGGKGAFAALDAALAHATEQAHVSGQDTRYLVEVRKGILALGDFFKTLKEDDLKQILPSIDLAHDLSADIQAGFKEGMSRFERAQYAGYGAIKQKRAANDTLQIIRPDNTKTPAPMVIENYSRARAPQYEADWFGKLFEASRAHKARRLPSQVPQLRCA